MDEYDISKLWIKEVIKVHEPELMATVWNKLGGYIALTYNYYTGIFHRKPTEITTIQDLMLSQNIIKENIQNIILNALIKVLNDIFSKEKQLPYIIDEFILCYEDVCRVNKVRDCDINRGLFLFSLDEFNSEKQILIDNYVNVIKDISVVMTAKQYKKEGIQLFKETNQVSYLTNSLIEKTKNDYKSKPKFTVIKDGQDNE
jgi:hypothetical protein